MSVMGLVRFDICIDYKMTFVKILLIHAVGDGGLVRLFFFSVGQGTICFFGSLISAGALRNL